MANITLGSILIPLPQIARALTLREIESIQQTTPLALPPHREPTALHTTLSLKQIRHLLLNFRIPKAITALLAGAALAMAGLIMQTIFANPLAGPFVFGISGGSSIGVALLILLSLQITTDPIAIGLAAILGSLSVGAIMIMFSTKLPRVALLIVGLAIGYAAQSIIEIMGRLSSARQLQRFVFWTFGDFGANAPSTIIPFIVVVSAGFISSLALARHLTILTAGDIHAKTVGVNPKTIRVIAIALVAFLAGTTVALCGPVSFIGVAAPHIGRFITRNNNHSALLPMSALAGANLALIVDTAAALPGLPIRLPINAATAIIVAPIIIFAIFGHKATLENKFDY